MYLTKKKCFIGGGVFLGLVLLALLPPLLWMPHIKNSDVPRSGEVLSLTEAGFILGGPRPDREVSVLMTASTTVKGDIVVGEFVQVFGETLDPHLFRASSVQVIDGPRKKNHE